MGVRGKIEAVIYAAEEPVTLAQLAALFGDEAVAERAAAAETREIDMPEPPSDEALALENVANADAGEGVGPEPSSQDGAREPDGDGEEEKRALRWRERARRETVRAVLDELMAEYDGSDRGMEIREIAGGFRVATKPEYHDAVRGFAKSLKPPMKLTLPALETLAVIAYKQPVTAPEVSEIRGVDSGGVLGSLVGRKLVTTAGRKQVVGRPILYKTTREFLLRFGLKDLNELPSMEEFEKMAGELASMGEELSESEPSPEPSPAPASSEEPNNNIPTDDTVAAGAAVQVEQGERPRLQPLAISVAVEEDEPGGVSVNRSGIVVADPAAPKNEEMDG